MWIENLTLCRSPVMKVTSLHWNVHILKQDSSQIPLHVWITSTKDGLHLIREGKDAWIQISCPSPVRIWKIRLTGRRSNSERITAWKLSAVVGERFIELYRSDTTLGSTMQEFLISPHRDYRTYRLIALSAEPGSVGLSYFQIFIKSYYSLR